MRTSGKIILCIAGFLGACLLIGGLQFISWNKYIPPTMIGSTAEAYKYETDLTHITKKWFDSYSNSLKGLNVPYDWRIHDASITYVTPLEQQGYVEIGYTMQPASLCPDVLSNLELIAMDGKYIGQKVLYWEQISDGWKISDVLTVAGYDLMFPSPEAQKENEIAENTHHYLPDTENPETYIVDGETLYVTYDGGITSAEVPDGYDLVCIEPNGIPDEYLEQGSYIVSPEFTGFIGYEDGHAVLLYSSDQGKSWNKSQIAPGYKALSFLSMTENGCYAAFATDRALGSDYYGAFRSDNLQNWTSVSMPEELLGHLSCAYWTDDGTGYFADGMTGYAAEPYTGTFQELSIQEPEDIITQLGYNPFHEIERIYEEDGLLYMVAGQGADGDYTKDGQLIQALYCSDDGINFYFKETISDNPVEAG